ncbi:MAG: hypothetical protein WEA04_04490 [Candidatus Andersenbacteria bacterium]
MAKQSLNLPYLLLTGIILVAIIAIFAIFQPMLKSLREQQAAVAGVEAAIVEKQQFLLTIDQKKEVLTRQQQHEQQLAVVLPTDDALDDATRIFHRTAETTGVTIIGLANNSEGEKSKVQALRARGELVNVPATIEPLAVNIEARGSYQQLRLFLEQLERSARLMDVVSLRLQRDPTTLDQLGARMDINFYKHRGENHGQ